MHGFRSSYLASKWSIVSQILHARLSAAAELQTRHCITPGLLLFMS